MRNFLLYFAGFLVVLIIQEFLLGSINLFSLLNVYLYIIIVIVLPMRLSTPAVLFSALAVGAVMDVFSGTSALITICLLAVGFARRAIFKFTLAPEIVSGGGAPLSHRVGQWAFLRYTFMMCLLFALIYFPLEMMTVEGLAYTLLRIVISSVATTLLVYIVQLPLKERNG